MRCILALALPALTACRDAIQPAGYGAGAPDSVSGDWADVSVGQNTSCAINRGGDAFCWGDNFQGRLGTGGRADAVPGPAPVRSAGVLFRHVSVGGNHQCALAVDGRAFCWGANNRGQLGTAAGGATAPTPVAGGLAFSTITAGFDHTCALTADGTAYCWGDNASGQLGAGSFAVCMRNDADCRSVVPVRVAGALRFQQLSAGWSHTCGITENGLAYCWGDNRDGELGDPSVPVHCNSACRRDKPTAVGGGLRFTSISAGGLHSCGIASGGSAFCWGLDTDDRAIGAAALGNASYSGYNGTPGGSRMPVRVEGGLLFRELSAGAGVTCGLTGDGMAYCWGDNNFGQLGLATMRPDFTTTPRAVRMPAAAKVPALSPDEHACALAARGRIWCWGGFNFSGEVGSPPLSTPGAGANMRPTPAPVTA